jgi:hypothetical protein
LKTPWTQASRLGFIIACRQPEHSAISSDSGQIIDEGQTELNQTLIGHYPIQIIRAQ